MGGTREGGLKSAAKLKANDPDYFKKLRARAKNVGGKHAANGFDADPERARSAGAKGGRVSRRSKAGDDDQKEVQLHSGQKGHGQSDSRTHGGTGGGARQSDQPTPGGGKS